MKSSLTIAKVAGTRITLHWTFVALIALMLLSGTGEGRGWNVVFILTVFLCVVLHELGHAWAAKRYGIRTQEITLLPIGGIAHLDRIPENPKEELIVAVAGPLVNLFIAAALFFPIEHEISKGIVNTLVVITGHNFLIHLFMVNLSLFLFNLLPIFPMDGGRILRALLAFRMDRVKATRVAARAGQAVVILFVVGGIFYGHLLSSNPLLIFIAFFIFFAAQTELAHVELRSFLSGFQVEAVTMKQYESLQTSDPLSKATALLLNGQARNFVIFDGERLVGTIGRDQIVKALTEGGSEVAIGEVMERNFKTMESTERLEKSLETLQQSKDRIAIVTKNKTLLGVVDLENILEFIMIHRASNTSLS